MIDNKGLEVSLDLQIEVQSIEDPELHLGLLEETMIGVLVAGSVVTLPKNALRRTTLQGNA